MPNEVVFVEEKSSLGGSFNELLSCVNMVHHDLAYIGDHLLPRVQEGLVLCNQLPPFILFLLQLFLSDFINVFVNEHVRLLLREPRVLGATLILLFGLAFLSDRQSLSV